VNYGGDRVVERQLIVAAGLREGRRLIKWPDKFGWRLRGSVPGHFEVRSSQGTRD